MRGVLLLVSLFAAGCGRIDFAAVDVADDARPIDAGMQIDLDFDDVADCMLLALTGDATCGSGTVVLNPEGNGLEGGAYIEMPFRFTSTSMMQLHAALEVTHAGQSPPGDGMVIVVHGDPRGVSALGGGADLGFNNIAPSVGIELDTFEDTFDPDDNHAGHDRDGDVSSSVTTVFLPFSPVNAGVFHAWLDYDGPRSEVAFFLAATAAKPAIPILVGSEDLARLGGTAHVGIVAGTAFAAEAHLVHALQLSFEP